VEAPTASEIRSWSRVDFDDLDFEEPGRDEVDPLEKPVRRANLWLQHTTGQIYEDLDERATDIETQWIIESMHLASMMLVEHAAFVAQPEIAATSADFNMVQSFSAGSYSETRRSPNSRSRGLHPWTDLADLLYDLMTDEKLAGFADGPAIITDDPRWDVGREIMGPGDQIMTPFGPFTAPWDFVTGNF
jgi:hypothetical protein